VIYPYGGKEKLKEGLILFFLNGEAQPRTESIIDEREEENMNTDHVYSHHYDGGNQDDVGENDEGPDVEELM
jgi:hypothetical protein